VTSLDRDLTWVACWAFSPYTSNISAMTSEKQNARRVPMRQLGSKLIKKELRFRTELESASFVSLILNARWNGQFFRLDRSWQQDPEGQEGDGSGHADHRDGMMSTTAHLGRTLARRLIACGGTELFEEGLDAERLASGVAAHRRRAPLSPQ
jgi:hypothetical protein